MKPAPKISKSMMWTLILTVASSAYFLTQDNGPAPSVKKKVAAKATSSNGNTVFTPEDYKANFPRVITTSNDVFTPIVKRKAALGGEGDMKDPSSIPTGFTGGEANWHFTGTAEIDGQITALLENTNGQDANFVKPGEKWKSSHVSSIVPDGVILVSDLGDKIYLTAKTVEPEAKTAPLNPTALSGPIGGLSVEADPTATPAATGRRGRGRRNGNGGGAATDAAGGDTNGG